MIEFESVTFRYRPKSHAALLDLSLTLRQGELVAVVGANGSGKSTLARLCDGLLQPESGRVTVDGLDTSDPGCVNDVRSLVGMVFQDPDDQIVGTVVEEDCAFGPENLGLPAGEIRARVDDALAAVGLTGLERREPHLLSEGQKQRLAIAGALAMRPRYVVFDEPSAMLDPRGRRSVVATLSRLAHEEGRGVLVVSHDVADIASADRVIGLEAGRVAFEGTVPDLLGGAGTMAALGLALPAVGRLAAELRARGVEVPPGAMDAESVAGAL